MTTDLTVNFPKGTAPYSVDIYRDVTNLTTSLTGSLDGDTYAVSEAGTYTLENLTDANGCIGTLSGSAVITTVDTVQTWDLLDATTMASFLEIQC